MSDGSSSRDVLAGPWPHQEPELDGAARIAADNPSLPRHDAAWWESYRGRVEQAARAAAPDQP